MKRTTPFLLALALAACSTQPPPSPAAAKPASTARSAVPDSGGGGDKPLAPLDRAKAVEGQEQDSIEKQKKELDEQSK